jgi:hypothetical protein
MDIPVRLPPWKLAGIAWVESTVDGWRGSIEQMWCNGGNGVEKEDGERKR